MSSAVHTRTHLSSAVHTRTHLLRVELSRRQCIQSVLRQSDVVTGESSQHRFVAQNVTSVRASVISGFRQPLDDVDVQIEPVDVVVDETPDFLAVNELH